MQPAGPSGTADQPATSGTSASTHYSAADQLESSCQSLERAGAQQLAGSGGASSSSSSFQFAVPHVRQSFNWDCGLACVLMALRALGKQRCDMAALQRLVGTQSIWTIDLAHLLARCGVGVSLLTITIGANPSYVEERFYAENMAEDEARVEQLFRAAPGAGIAVEQRSVPLPELRALLLAGQHLAIALVDKNKFCGGGGGTPSPLQLSPMAAGPAAAAGLVPDPGAAAAAASLAGGRSGGGQPGPSSAAYTGHYVLLCGYDSAGDCFSVCDPASARERLQVPAARLDAARRSYGTDEDLLLIAIPPGLQARG